MLSMDFWAWDSSTPMVMGLPLWVGYYFVLLSALQTGVMVFWVKNNAGADRKLRLKPVNDRGLKSFLMNKRLHY